MSKHYHFIGIGGIGMSALARILLTRGAKVTGSDQQLSSTIENLRKEGAQIRIGHEKKNIKGADFVVFTSGISLCNVEYLEAEKLKIPLLHRSNLLAQILEGFAPLLVTGTHGKTTTSSLLAHTLVEAGLDPSYAIGGYLQGNITNGRSGRGIYFAVEADESDGSFLNYPSFGAIITNLEHDHMDFWKTGSALLEGFKEFAEKVGSKDHLFWCYDDPSLRSLNLQGTSYGFEEGADLHILNFSQTGWKASFDIHFGQEKHKSIEIPMIGAHNVLNAAAVFGLGRKIDISPDRLRKCFTTFSGVKRRVEKKGEYNGIDVYDDYAHHPTEIFSTIRALKKTYPKRRVVVAFQPHRYSRTQYCLHDFASAFSHADQVIITDICSANEPKIPELSLEKIVSTIQKGGYQAVSSCPRPALAQELTTKLQKGDVLLTMGAGDITEIGPKILASWEASHR